MKPRKKRRGVLAHAAGHALLGLLPQGLAVLGHRRRHPVDDLLLPLLERRQPGGLVGLLLLDLLDQVLGLLDLAQQGPQVHLGLLHPRAHVGVVARQQGGGLVEDGAQPGHLLLGLGPPPLQRLEPLAGAGVMSFCISSPWPLVTQPRASRSSPEGAAQAPRRR